MTEADMLRTQVDLFCGALTGSAQSGRAVVFGARRQILDEFWDAAR